jgi:hypothetical protein
MLLAKFLLGDGGGDVTVSVFPGDMGGVPAVANLWRGQLGLSEASDAEIQKLTGSLDVMGGKAILIDMSGKKSGQDTRMIGVIAPRGDRTWFYKLTGVPTVADREKDAFIRFVQSVRYPDA